MKTAEQLREALHKLDYQALKDSTEDGIKKIIEKDNDEMHPAHSILIGIGSLRHNPKETSTEETDIEKAYKCIKVLTQKYPPFLELVDDTGNTLSILYASQDLAPKEAVLKLLLDPEVKIANRILHSKNNQADPTLSQHSLAELISKDADYIIPKINSLEAFERFKAFGIFSVNSKDSNGKTILHHEFALSSLDVFKELIESGAELVPDNEGKTPYDIAKETNRDEIVHLIEERVSKNFANGQLTNQKLTAQEALEIIAVHVFGTFIKATGGDATAYLLKSSREVNGLSAVLLSLLVVNGANINGKDRYGSTPLHWATRYRKTEVAKLLIEHRADVNGKNNDGLTSLDYAAYYGQTEIAKLLIEKGADVNVKSKYGFTALFQAVLNGHIEIAKLLLAHCADVNDKVINGYTQLHFAAYDGYTDLVKLLIEHGANVNAQNNDGKTPLDFANRNGRTEVVNLLKKLDKSSLEKAARNEKLIKAGCGLALCLAVAGAVYCYRNPKVLAEAGTFLSNKTSYLTDNVVCNAICKFAKSIVEMFTKLIPASLRAIV